MASLVIREPESIYRAEGQIERGTFRGRWHFSFDGYRDPENERFDTLRVFNDDTLSPGAVWPLHPHRDNEVVTYCAEGEFRHADERGKGGILEKGWVQHTTVGRGMMHSEINNLPDRPMRFIQMWFIPRARGLEPAVEQKPVDRDERTNRLLVLVSGRNPDALPLASDAEVLSCFLQENQSVRHPVPHARGAYLYVLEGGPVRVNGRIVPTLGAVRAEGELGIEMTAEKDAELLLADVSLGPA
ncbi:MAG: pirin family protein [Candidatus Abyssobacteria bacterium SURF_5]|uniref:Pirin family protein n=1 Tax=Abyssobacteria bacterium (strain SURF_5) TaxID=2093360 RepID=A0A3A4NJM0_ABYX5|nr:MAG: pirin family protein [Candidatus Abyssubacteria bacterium SURF_5]